MFVVQGMALPFRITIKITGMYPPPIVSVKNTFERRIGIWPAGFDKDDVMWCNTSIW